MTESLRMAAAYDAGLVAESPLYELELADALRADRSREVRASAEIGYVYVEKVQS